MTVTAFRLENFMAFKDTGWLELRPITLLFGRNSSGKSVLIRALRMLKQSFSSAMMFKLNDEYGVELGETPGIFHGNYDSGYFNSADFLEKNQTALPEICFGFEIDLSQETILDELVSLLKNHDQITNQEPIERKDISIKMTIGYRWRDTEGFVISTLMLEVENKSLFKAERLFDDSLINTLGIQWVFDSEVLHSFEVEGGEFLWADLGIQSDSGAPMLPVFVIDNQNTYLDEAEFEFYKLQNILADVNRCIQKFFEEIVYIRPIRPLPELVYTFDIHTQEHWQKMGMSGYYEFLCSNIDEQQAREIDDWMNRLDLGENVEVDFRGTFLGGGGSRVEVNSDGQRRYLCNVGFGVSQVLPIIVESILSTRNSLVIIEQPELHLHPRAQAELTSLFIYLAQKGARFLVETHSENILHRLRLHVAETKLQQLRLPKDEMNAEYQTSENIQAAKNVSINFIERNNGVSTISEIMTNEFGEYKNPHPGFMSFFADDAKIIMDTTKAILEAKREDRRK